MNNKTYGIIGIATIIVFWTTYIIMSTIRPEYSMYTKAISELGSIDAPKKWIWNSIGYLTTGVLIAIYAVGLHKNIANEKSSKLPLYSILLSGVFMALSGIFPADFENRQATTMLLHTVGSFGSYIFFLIGAFSYPKQMRKSEYWKQAIKPTLIFTWLTILFGSWPFIFPNIPALGQRFVFFFYFLWIIYTAIRLYRQPKKSLVANDMYT